MPRSWLWARETSREPRPTRPSAGSHARTGPTRTCWPTPTSTRSTSRCRTRCTSSGRSARSRPASTCCARSRWRATRPRSSAAFDAAERAQRVLMEAFMWRFHVQTEELVRLGADDRRAALRARGVRLQPAGLGERPLAGRARGRRADGRRLLLRERAAADLRRRARARVRRAGDPRRGVDARFAGVLRFPGDVLGSFDCGMDVHRRNFIEVVGSEATIEVPSPWQTPEAALILVNGERGRARDGRSRTRASWRSSAAPSRAAHRLGSGEPTRSARRARSRRSTGRPTRAGP